MIPCEEQKSNNSKTALELESIVVRVLFGYLKVEYETNGLAAGIKSNDHTPHGHDDRGEPARTNICQMRMENIWWHVVVCGLLTRRSLANA